MGWDFTTAEPHDHASLLVLHDVQRMPPQSLGSFRIREYQKCCMTAGRLAISTFTQSKVVFKGSLATELKLSEASVRSSLVGQAYASTVCLHIYTGSKAVLCSFPRRPSPFPVHKTSKTAFIIYFNTPAQVAWQ